MIPGVLVFRVDTSLHYFNAHHVRDAVSRTGGLRLVVGDLSTSSIVDLNGAKMQATSHTTLKGMSIRIRLVAPHTAVRDILRAEGLEERTDY